MVDGIHAILKKVKSSPSDELEGETLEFKRYRSVHSLYNAKELAGEISALANTQGGKIVIGVRDSSDVSFGQWTEQLSGFPDVDTSELMERLLGRLTPKPKIEVTDIQYEGDNYIVIDVPIVRDILVSTTSGKVMTREGKSSRPMTPHEITTAVKGLQSYDWSAQDLDLDPTEVLDVDSVDAARDDFEERRDLTLEGDAHFLESIGATQNGRLTKGGLLFLGKPNVIQGELGLYEFRFTWRNKAGELERNDVWTSNLWRSIIRAKNHFRDCNYTGRISFQNETYEVPLLDPIAFHEAYLNALVHRDYSVDGMVVVSFDPDGMRVTSPGTFYGGVTAENIARHQPRHRNKALANILMSFHLVDRAGQGIIRMSRNSLRYGRGMPDFRELDDSVEVFMEGEFIRPGMFVLSAQHPDDFGIPDLLIANALYDRGFVPVSELELRLQKITAQPWRAINTTCDRFPYFDLCGVNEGVFVRANPEHRDFFATNRSLRLSTRSNKHVKIYDYLKQHGEISNSEATQLLGYSHASSTSVFFRESEYLKQRGGGSTARWVLKEEKP